MRRTKLYKNTRRSETFKPNGRDTLVDMHTVVEEQTNIVRT